jgi:hypothetical protein
MMLKKFVVLTIGLQFRCSGPSIVQFCLLLRSSVDEQMGVWKAAGYGRCWWSVINSGHQFGTPRGWSSIIQAPIPRHLSKKHPTSKIVTTADMQEMDILILGAGWTSTFLIPLLKARNLTYAATSTTGREGTIKFKFDPSETDPTYFKTLPAARNILITFPLTEKGQAHRLVWSYNFTHQRLSRNARYLQLGSTGIWQIDQKNTWVDRHSPYNKENARAIAEDELISMDGCVLNLAGLWGGERQPKNWVGRVATTKEQVKSKKSLHLIHGEDVARAILAIFEKWEQSKASGSRWMLTDGQVYCWWSLMAGWAKEGKHVDEEPSKQSRWVYELMEEEGVKALPRDMETLGRCYDSRDFWKTFDLTPLRSRI